MTTTRTEVLAVALAALTFGACVEQQSPDNPSEEDLKAARANILTQAPTPRFVVNADLGGRATIIGCDLDTDAVEVGKPFTVTTYWKVNQPITDGWRMFFHVNGAVATQFQNHDHIPLGGKYPVSRWKQGEILRDIYKVTLPPNWAGGEVNLYTGLWKGAERMKVTSGPQDGVNRVLLAKLAVKAGPGGAVAQGGAAIGRKRYIARKVATAPKIDGQLSDLAWKDAPETETFVNTLSGAPVEQRTVAKMVYDDKNLYIAFQNEDTDIWSDLVKHDDKLWTQEADEIMIDGDGDGRTYIELQVNPAGATFDTYYPSYRQPAPMGVLDWESKMRTAVKVEGTLGKRDDTDKRWTVELALPLESVKGRAEHGPAVPPKVGDVWRINLYRMDTPKGKPQVGSGWSPPLVGDFHALDKFGDLVFGDDKGNVPHAISHGPAQGGAASVAGVGQRATPGAPVSRTSAGSGSGIVPRNGKSIGSLDRVIIPSDPSAPKTGSATKSPAATGGGADQGTGKKE